MNLQLMYVDRYINPVVCEVMDLSSAVTSNGRLIGRLILVGPCGGGLEVPTSLNGSSTECVEVTSGGTLDIVVDTIGKLANNSLIVDKVLLVLETRVRGQVVLDIPVGHTKYELSNSDLTGSGTCASPMCLFCNILLRDCNSSSLSNKI